LYHPLDDGDVRFNFIDFLHPTIFDNGYHRLHNSASFICANTNAEINYSKSTPFPGESGDRF